MPFGLTNAPATFQCLMDVIFRDHIGKDTNAFLDDLLTHTKAEIDIVPKFRRNLQLLVQNGLKCKARKCKILPKRLSYLGHDITSNGILPSLDKIEKVINWPFPTTGTEMFSFVSFCNYYRKLIPKFADTASCLYEASKEKSIPHIEQLVTNFEHLKNDLVSITGTRIPNPDRPFILETDASQIAIGGVLKQKEGDEEYPVQWFSKALTGSERNYSTYERELYAVVKTCESCQVYLLGREFTLRTDHQALMAIFRNNLSTSTRIIKWVMRLQPYKFTIEIIPGKENIVADALSRIPWPV